MHWTRTRIEISKLSGYYWQNQTTNYTNNFLWSHVVVEIVNWRWYSLKWGDPCNCSLWIEWFPYILRIFKANSDKIKSFTVLKKVENTVQIGYTMISSISSYAILIASIPYPKWNSIFKHVNILSLKPW